jgi:putative membrane protein
VATTGSTVVSYWADQVSKGTADVASGAGKLHDGAKRLAGSAGRLASSSSRLAGAAGHVASGSSRLASADARLAKADRLLAAELAVLTRLCAPAGAGDRFCAAMDRTHQHALTLAGAAHRLAGGSSALAGSTHRLASGNRKLAHGNHQLASGARKLSGSSASLSTGAHRVHTGAGSVASGAASVDQAAGSLAAGSTKAAAGGASVASGASSVSSSAGSVSDGANQLSSGLAKGAKESPTYSSSQQKALEDTVSQPIDLTHSLQNDKHGNGWLMAALVALVLWLAAVAGALRGDPGRSLRQSAAPVSSRRLAFSRLLPVLALAVVEAAGVLVALLLLDVGAADVVGFVVMTVVAALTFTAVAFATRLMLGRAGIAALVVVLLVQVAALGNVIPLETAPGPLRALNAALPLPAYVDGASQLLTGGSVGNRAVDLVVLLAWGAGACVATVLTVRRRRVAPTGDPVAPTPVPTPASA